jgi:uncharacterized protein
MVTADSRELVRDLYAALQKGDTAPVTAAVADDVVWTMHSPHSESPLGGQRIGPAGVEEFFGHFTSKLETERFEVRHILADENVVVALIDIECTVTATGKSAAGPLVHVMTLKDGKIATFEGFSHVADECAWV